MNAVAKFFLRAKHWQIFFPIFGLFFLGEITFAVSVPAAEPTDAGFQKAVIATGIFTALFMLFFVSWFWSLGSFLTSIVNPSIRLRMRFFRFSLLFPLIYLPGFIAVFDSMTTSPGLFLIIFPLHAFATYCMFYLLYFVSKSLALAERNQPVSFYDYSGSFFLLWFFPIGIWIVQPRINRLYDTSIASAHQGP